ncbi:ABC transporter permease [Streptosporangium vulgare]|uniref:ABC transporter permease n=1 Tax=Streptosporangium vulgare TaxID=46190 RepID=UPI003CD0A7A4
MSGTGMVTDTVTVFNRELRPVLRNPFSVIFTMVQPLFFLALFAPLLPAVEGGSALQWFVPGIVVMSCLFGTSSTGANLLFEIQTGSHERMLVSPLRRPALIVGRALKEIVPVLAQTVVVVAVTVPFGFRPHLLGALLGLLVLAVFCVGLGALSYTLALASKDSEWMFWGGPADPALPADAARRDAAARQRRPRLVAGALAAQPADVRRGGRARPVQRRDRLGGDGWRPGRGGGRGRAGPARRHPGHAPRLTSPGLPRSHLASPHPCPPPEAPHPGTAAGARRRGDTGRGRPDVAGGAAPPVSRARRHLGVAGRARRRFTAVRSRSRPFTASATVHSSSPQSTAVPPFATVPEKAHVQR